MIAHLLTLAACTLAAHFTVETLYRWLTRPTRYLY